MSMLKNVIRTLYVETGPTWLDSMSIRNVVVDICRNVRVVVSDECSRYKTTQFPS